MLLRHALQNRKWFQGSVVKLLKLSQKHSCYLLDVQYIPVFNEELRMAHFPPGSISSQTTTLWGLAGSDTRTVDEIIMISNTGPKHILLPTVVVLPFANGKILSCSVQLILWPNIATLPLFWQLNLRGCSSGSCKRNCRLNVVLLHCRINTAFIFPMPSFNTSAFTEDSAEGFVKLHLCFF